MDFAHRRQHLRDLRGRLHFLRTLTPDSKRYKLWLGDMIEFVHVAYGVESPELAEVRAIVTRYARPPLTESERAIHYTERLNALDAFLQARERANPEPITFFEG
jgi:hypothetical protein